MPSHPVDDLEQTSQLVDDAVRRFFSNDVPGGLQILEVVSSLLEKSDSPDSLTRLADTKFQLGKILGELQQYGHSVSLISQASEIYHSLHLKEKEAQTHLYLGEYEMEIGDHANGIIHFRTAVDMYLELGESFTSRSYFAYAERSYYVVKGILLRLLRHTGDERDMIVDVMSREVMARLGHFKDLVTVANYYAYSDNFEEAKKAAWRALLYALDTVPLIVRRHMFIHGEEKEEIHDELLKGFVRVVLDSIPMCRNALTHVREEFTPVIELKLDELVNYFEEIGDDVPDSVDEVYLWTNTQKESLKFLIPRRVPDFVFLTPGGRLIYYFTKTYIEDFRDGVASHHLLGGILTAINSIMMETNIIGEGSVQEISAVGGTLLLEARKNVIVAAICDIIFPDIRNFLKDVADFVQERYGDTIRTWMGSTTSLEPMIRDLKHQLDAFTL